jgi:hypothetical protein
MIPGHPMAAAVCRYGPAAAGKAPRLAARQVITRRIYAVASIVNRLAPLSSNGVGAFCPFDDGSEVVLLIAYADRQTATVEIHLTGCQFVSNELMTADTTPDAQHALEALLRIRFGRS